MEIIVESLRSYLIVGKKICPKKLHITQIKSSGTMPYLLPCEISGFRFIQVTDVSMLW